jgi:hypothetical protein
MALSLVKKLARLAEPRWRYSILFFVMLLLAHPVYKGESVGFLPLLGKIFFSDFAALVRRIIVENGLGYQLKIFA